LRPFRDWWATIETWPHTRQCRFLSSSQQRSAFNLKKYYDSCFQRTTCAIYLGVLIDSSLDWSFHVQYIKSKLVRASDLFYKIRNVVSMDVLKMLCFRLVHCHLKYCIISWGTATNSVLQPLEVVHNNILRTIRYNNYRFHITPLYKSLNFLKLHDIHKLELAKPMHKFHHEMLPTSFKDLFPKTADVLRHNTRYATNQNYFIQQVSTNAGKKTISHRGATLWASAEQQFKDQSHNAFSDQYRAFLLLQYEWMSKKQYYWINLVKFLIKILSLHLSYRLHIRLACVSGCSCGL